MSAIDFSDPATIAALTDALTKAGVDGVEISAPNGHLRIVISREESAQAGAKPNTKTAQAVIAKAPIAGRFCLSRPSASDEAEAFPRKISSGDAIGFILIGSILVPVVATRSGSLTRQFAETDALVGFGDSLFEIEPET